MTHLEAVPGRDETSVCPGRPKSPRRPVAAAALLLAVLGLFAACQPVGSSGSPATGTTSASARPGTSTAATPTTQASTTSTATPTASAAGPTSTSANATGSPAGGADSAAAGGSGGCQLRVTTSDPREGPRQRTTVETLTFSNAGSAPCRLGGERPVRSTTAQFVGPDKTSAVGQSATGYGGDFSLAPGESFATTLTTNSIFGLDDERCGEAPVGGVQIFAPVADAVAVTVPARLATVCTNRQFGSFLEVGALPARG